MHSFVTSKNVKWCHLIWPTRYIQFINIYPILTHWKIQWAGSS